MLVRISDGRAKALPPASLASLVSKRKTLMNQNGRTIVKQVLTEAVDAPHFFDYSDAQRLNWMIERAYELGQAMVRPTRVRKSSGATGASCLPLEIVIQLREPAKSKRCKPRRRRN